MKKLYCTICNDKVDCTEACEIKTYDYKGTTVNVEEHIKKCSVCNEELFDEEEEERIINEIYSKYLEEYKLSYEKIKGIREKFGLSQELFANLMNWSKKTVTRYENKQSIPQGEYLNKYIELNNDPDKIEYYLLFSKNYLDTNEYNKIAKALEKQGHFSIKKEKINNLIMYFLSKKELYTTQLMKYLFASDFLYYKEYGTSITGSNYAKLPFGPVLDNYKDIINDLCRSGMIEISCIEMVEEKTGEAKDTCIYKSLKKCDTSLFSDNEMIIIENITKKFKNLSSKKLSNWSHEFIGWKETDDSKIIDYEYAKYLEI